MKSKTLVNHLCSSCLRSCERFDWEKGAWEMLPPLNEARRAHCAVSLPDGVYVLGGFNGKDYLTSVERFDEQKNEWTVVGDMRHGKCAMSAVVTSDCQFIYVLGGYNGEALGDVERYDVMMDAWEVLPPMSTKRFMHMAVSVPYNSLL